MTKEVPVRTLVNFMEIIKSAVLFIHFYKKPVRKEEKKWVTKQRDHFCFWEFKYLKPPANIHLTKLLGVEGTAKTDKH